MTGSELIIFGTVTIPAIQNKRNVNIRQIDIQNIILLSNSLVAEIYRRAIRRSAVFAAAAVAAAVNIIKRIDAVDRHIAFFSHLSMSPVSFPHLALRQTDIADQIQMFSLAVGAYKTVIALAVNDIVVDCQIALRNCTSRLLFTGQLAAVIAKVIAGAAAAVVAAAEVAGNNRSLYAVLGTGRRQLFRIFRHVPLGAITLRTPAAFVETVRIRTRFVGIFAAGRIAAFVIDRTVRVVIAGLRVTVFEITRVFTLVFRRLARTVKRQTALLTAFGARRAAVRTGTVVARTLAADARFAVAVTAALNLRHVVRT